MGNEKDKNLLPNFCFYSSLSCTQKQDKESNVTEGTPKKAIGIVNADSIAPPEIIMITAANTPKVIPAGKPKIKVNPLGDGLGELTGTNFTLADGLPEEYIRCIYTDRDGNIWFSGMDGVNKYDGSSFTHFTTANGLVDNLAHCIMQDKTGAMWFGTNKGISKFDGTLFSNYPRSDGLVKNTVVNIMQDRAGNLWFGTTNGVYKYDGKTFSSYERSEGLTNNIDGIIEDNNGNIWFVSEKGLTRYNGKTFTYYTTKQGLVNDTLVGACKDKSGNLWFGSPNGLIKYNGSTFTTYTTRDGLESNEVRVLTGDPSGNVWLVYYTPGVTGLSKFDGSNFTNYAKPNGLTNKFIYCMAGDRLGNLWMANGGGLSKVRGNYLTNFTSELLSEKIGYSAIENDKSGQVWFGTSNGICKYDGKILYSYNIDLGRKTAITIIHNDHSGNLWLSVPDIGVIKFDGKLYTVFTKVQGLAITGGFRGVNCITEDKAGNLWFGSDNGLSKYDGKSFTNFKTAQGLVSNYVASIKEDHSGTLWIGTAEGLSKYDGKKFTNYTTDNYTTKQDLPANVITCIMEDKTGNLWFSTNGGGISKYDGRSFTNFLKKDGLLDNTVWKIKEDSLNDMLWCGTKQGLSGLKISSLKKGQPEFENYNTGTGYPIGSIYALSIDNNGILWGGNQNTNEYFRFDYKAYKDVGLLRLQIKKVELNDENVCWHNLRKVKSDSTGQDSLAIRNEMVMAFGKELTAGELNTMAVKYKAVRFDSISQFYPVPQNLILPYYHNNIGFEFTANAPGYGKQVQYQFILEGYDKKWSTMSNNTNANFGNISEGTYTFKLKARSPFGVWSETTYTFKVLPPWWRTWWFRTLAVVALLLLFYSIYRWRTATLRKQKRILEQTVRVRTAEVVKQKEKSEELLLNILPSEVADELKEKGYTTAKSFDEVTVLFSDIKGFTNIAEKMTAQELVKEIDTYFSAFDNIIQKYGLEKIKTIGDAYIAAGGLPERNSATAENVVQAAIAMQQEVEKLKQERALLNKPYFELRIGIHTGPVVAGVVGIKKFQYDIWGDTVNLAARMEQSGVPGKINISQLTYELVKDQFNCVHRGKIEAKNKGEVDMYFVE